MNRESSVSLMIGGWKRSILMIAACFALTVRSDRASLLRDCVGW